VVPALVVLALLVVGLLSFVLYDRLTNPQAAAQPIAAVKSQDVDIACELVFDGLTAEQLDRVEADDRSYAKDQQFHSEGRSMVLAKRNASSTRSSWTADY